MQELLLAFETFIKLSKSYLTSAHSNRSLRADLYMPNYNFAYKEIPE